MKRQFEFIGKRIPNGNGRRYKAYVTVELMDDDMDNPIFSAHIDKLWGTGMSGQCFDACNLVMDNSVFSTIYGLWREYHRNDMHAGTEDQEYALRNFPNANYEERCWYLKQKGLYEVNYEGMPYRYGTKWLYRKIPSYDLERIKKLILEGEVYG